MKGVTAGWFCRRQGDEEPGCPRSTLTMPPLPLPTGVSLRGVSLPGLTGREQRNVWNFIYCNSSQKIILLLPLICSKHVLQFAKVEHSIRHLPHCLVCPVGRLGFGGGFLLA